MKLLKILLAITISSTVIANSAMIFPQRAILDEKSKTSSFKVINTSDVNVKYQISIIDRVQEDSGKTFVTDNYQFSAKKHLTFSPRKSIKLAKHGKKPIRIKLKNYGALKDGEYRSYLSVITDNDQPDDVVGYKVGVKTGIQLPIIIRKGKLSATAKIKKAEMKDGKINVTLNREGTRSIFGDINITQDEKELGFIKGVAVFVESNTATYTVTAKELDINKEFTITFKESEESGDISITQKITL